MDKAYPPIAPDLLRNCHALNADIDRVVITYTGVYVRQKDSQCWSELKNLLEAQRPAVAINSI